MFHLLTAYLVVTCIFFEMHACNARYLSSHDKEITKKGTLLTRINMYFHEYASRRVHLPTISIPLEVMSRVPRKFGAQREQKIVNEDDHDVSFLGAIKKDQDPIFKEGIHGANRENSGNKNIIVSPLKDLPDQTTTEISKRLRGRSMMLRSSSQEDVESSKNEDDRMVEDIDVMDYAQPHRKPPIHNEKP